MNDVRFYRTLSGNCLVEDQFAETHAIDSTDLFFGLLAIGEHVPMLVIEQWSDDDRRQVINYASRELHHSIDNSSERQAVPTILMEART